MLLIIKENQQRKGIVFILCLVVGAVVSGDFLKVLVRVSVV
tara:strand:- start:1750 stop:1872 length:123 start_codon:yes stop_codon:yes gene_type:complete